MDILIKLYLLLLTAELTVKTKKPSYVSDLQWFFDDLVEAWGLSWNPFCHFWNSWTGFIWFRHTLTSSSY